MNNNEKMFEEQIREIDECNKKDCKDCVCCAYYYALTRFCEDKIVLTKEELNDLEYKAYARGVNSFNELHEKQLEKTKKETALRFSETLKEELEENCNKIGEQRSEYLIGYERNECIEIIDEVAKKL